MDDTRNIVEGYIHELEKDGNDDAWHALVELGPVALPYVLQAFETMHTGPAVVDLLRIVMEYRTPDALPFLASRLQATDRDIWKTALDGIVAIGGEASVACLHEASRTLNIEKRTWVDEAIEQIRTKSG